MDKNEFRKEFEKVKKESVNLETTAVYNDEVDNVEDNYSHDRFHYLLDLADTYEQEVRKLQELQNIRFSEARKQEIDKLNKKWEDVLADYEKFSLEDKGEDEEGD